MGQLKQKIIGISIFILLISFLLVIPTKVSADSGGAKISLTFDDALLTTYTNALPIMIDNNLKGAVFVPINYVGKANHMDWNQLRTLQNTYGWEIGSHTVSHLELPVQSLSKIRTQLSISKAKLIEEGLSVSSFASPYGAYDNTVLTETLKLYNLHRGFWDTGTLNVYPYDRSVIKVKSVDKSITLNQVYGWINQAIQEGNWLVLVFHEVQPSSSSKYLYTTTTENFDLIAKYIKNSNIDVVLPNITLEKPGANLLTGNSFESGIPSDWSTDNSSMVSLDLRGNGSYPSSSNSILMKGGNTSSHLFSNIINSNIDSSFSFEVFVNAVSLASGEVGFYIDEYDENDNWISGQWIGAVWSNSIKYFTYIYSPTSDAVYKFQMQTYIDGGSKGFVYLDNYGIYTLVSGTPHEEIPVEDPPVEDPPHEEIPVEDSPVESENLVKNGSFESLTSNWVEIWLRDNEGFTVDTNAQGNDGNNSLHFLSSVTSAHVFSEKIKVSSGLQYVWKQYLKASYNKGEFGFYIDEYDVEDNWISGQWKGELKSSYTGYKEIQYTPTSSSVVKIRLQYYVVPDSNIDLFIDSVSLVEI